MEENRREEWAGNIPPREASCSPTTGVGGMAQREAGDTGLLMGRRGSSERLPASWMLTASVLSRNDAHTCSPLAGSGRIRHPISWLFLPFSSLLSNNLFFPLTAYVLVFHLIETVKGIRWRLNLSASPSMLMCIEQAPLPSKPSLSKGTQEFAPSLPRSSVLRISPPLPAIPVSFLLSAVQILQLLPHPLLPSKTKFLGDKIYISWLRLVNLPCTLRNRSQVHLHLLIFTVSTLVQAPFSLTSHICLLGLP